MRRLLLLSGLVIVGLSTYNFSLLHYAYKQGIGQLSIVWHSRPVNEVLGEADISDSLKQQLQLVQAIREFAFDSLGLKHSDNYTTFYDQKGKPILWAVTASDRFRLRAYQWYFPFLGAVPYKGFFEHAAAVKEDSLLRQKGYDTGIGNIRGWSTLGWFKDPILSGMLENSEGALANLIIHELWHGTLFVKDSVDFNENLASFAGEQGAVLFLQSRYGQKSEQLQAYQAELIKDRAFVDYMLLGAKQLDSLYCTFNEKQTEEFKEQQKQLLIHSLVDRLDSLAALGMIGQRRKSPRLKYPNNTLFMDFLRYDSRRGDFLKELQGVYGSDIKAYLTALRKRYSGL